jgi:ABC-type phosphate/phosphonate transport system substrate-binding protein
MKSTYFSILLVVFSAILLVPATVLTAGHEMRIPTPLRVGFSARVFPNVDQRDARIAMELWTRELARGLGYKVEPQTIIFQKPNELMESVNKGEMTVVTLPATEYLQMRDRVRMTPEIVEASNEGLSRRFQIIVRKDSGIRSLADLRGKTIFIPSSSRFNISHVWLDVLLMREGHGDRASYFRDVKESAASKSIMGVFFRKADAAIVTRSALETSKSLNAQVGRDLTIIAESKNLIGDVTCVPLSVNDDLKRSIENAALHLHETATGRQMFTLFQIERTIPFKSSYMDGIIELLRERDRLAGKIGKKR